MAVDFSQFTPKTSAQPTDYIVGYDQNASGGEKKYTVSTLANSVSGIAKNALQDGVLSKIGSSITPAADFNTFATGSIPSATDKLVGFVSTSAGGERKWDLSTIAQAISGLIQQEILNKAMTTLGNYPYLEYAWVTAPNAAGQTITANVLTTLNLTTKVLDKNNLGSISANQLSIPSGTYALEAVVNLAAGNNPMLASLRLYDGTNTITQCGPTSVSTIGVGTGSHAVFFKLRSQFTVASTTNVSLQILSSTGGTVLNGSGSSSVGTGTEQRTTIKLWKVG